MIKFEGYQLPFLELETELGPVLINVHTIVTVAPMAGQIGHSVMMISGGNQIILPHPSRKVIEAMRELAEEKKY